jgi:ABC-type nitrate/sulfonate/bicarbonate transport system permease component
MHTIHKHRNGRRPCAGTPCFRYFQDRKKSSLIYSFFGFLVLGTVWQLAGLIQKNPAIPSLYRISKMFFFLIRDGPYMKHIAASLAILLTGLGAASCIGFTLGLLLYRYKRFNAAVFPVIECIRGVASLTLFPLLIVLFGLGPQTRIFIIFWTAWPAIVLSTYNSLNVDENVVNAARTSGAGEWRVMISIRIPMALQGILTGIRIGAGGAWVALIPAEMLGASKGLGYFLLWNAQSFEFEKVYAAIITVAAIGGLMNMVLSLIQKKLYQITGEQT